MGRVIKKSPCIQDAGDDIMTNIMLREEVTYSSKQDTEIYGDTNYGLISLLIPPFVLFLSIGLNFIFEPRSSVPQVASLVLLLLGVALGLLASIQSLKSKKRRFIAVLAVIVNFIAIGFALSCNGNSCFHV